MARVGGPGPWGLEPCFSLEFPYASHTGKTSIAAWAPGKTGKGPQLAVWDFCVTSSSGTPHLCDLGKEMSCSLEVEGGCCKTLMSPVLTATLGGKCGHGHLEMKRKRH